MEEGLKLINLNSNLLRIILEYLNKYDLKIISDIKCTHLYKVIIRNPIDYENFKSYPGIFKFNKEIDECNPFQFAIFHNKEELILVYSTANNAIILYSLEKEKKLKALIKSHTRTIFSLNHHYSITLQKHLLASSSGDGTIKLWDLFAGKHENILKIDLKKNSCYLVKMFAYKDKDYIIYSCFGKNIKCVNIKGKLIKEFGRSLTILDGCFDFLLINNNLQYIFICSKNGVYLYNFDNENKIISSLGKDIIMKCTVQKIHHNDLLYTLKEYPGNFEIWDIHTFSKIKDIIVKSFIRNFLVWNEQYILTINQQGLLECIDTNDYSISIIPSKNNIVYKFIEKAFIPKLGECLIMSYQNLGIPKMIAPNVTTNLSLISLKT